MNTYNNYFESKGNPAFNVGERVLVHQYGVLATIEAVTWHPERGGEYGYTVKFDKRVRDTWGDKPKMISTGEYGCFGITTSFDEKGQEVADANYFRQSVFMFVHPHYCGTSREFCFDDIDVKATKYEDESGRWLVVKKQGESTFNYVKTTDELCTMLAELHASMPDPTERLKEQWCKAFQIMMEGGQMFQYGGLHFKGTHTLKELGLADAPDYVLTEVVRFGWAPEHMQYYTGDDPKAVHSDWSQTEFLRAAKDSDRYDVYLCMETGHYYYPAAEKIADVCMESLSENIRYWIKEHEEREVA